MSTPPLLPGFVSPGTGLRALVCNGAPVVGQFIFIPHQPGPPPKPRRPPRIRAASLLCALFALSACNRDSDPCQDTVTGHLEAYAKGTGLDGGTLAALDVRVTKSSTERLAVGEHVTVPVASIAFDEGYPPDTVLLTGRPDPACAGVAEPWFNVGAPCFRACTVGFRFPDLGVSD